MKKILVSLVAAFILMTCFTACSSQANQETHPESIVVENETTEENVIAEDFVNEDFSVVEDATQVDEETMANIPEKNDIVKIDFEPCKGQLSENEQKVYDEFMVKIRNYEEFVVDFADSNSNIDYEGFYRVTEAIRGDYNEIRLFLKTSELYSDEMYNGEARYISVSYEYSWLIRDEFDPQYMNDYLEEINEVCDEIIARMPSDATYAEKYEFLGREICKMTVYGENDVNNVPDEEVDWSYAYMNGPFLHGKAICQGYAYAYKYLCNRAGLWCVTVSGGCHCWNLVMLEDGSTYHVDLTWGDVGDDLDGYFLLTQEEIEEDHTPYVDEWKATGK